MELWLNVYGIRIYSLRVLGLKKRKFRKASDTWVDLTQLAHILNAQRDFLIPRYGPLAITVKRGHTSAEIPFPFISYRRQLYLPYVETDPTVIEYVPSDWAEKVCAAIEMGIHRTVIVEHTGKSGIDWVNSLQVVERGKVFLATLGYDSSGFLVTPDTKVWTYVRELK